MEDETIVFGLHGDSELKHDHGWTGLFIAELKIVSSGVSNQLWPILYGIDYGILLRDDDAGCGTRERSCCRCPRGASRPH